MRTDPFTRENVANTAVAKERNQADSIFPRLEFGSDARRLFLVSGSLDQLQQVSVQ